MICLPIFPVNCCSPTLRLLNCTNHPPVEILVNIAVQMSVLIVCLMLKEYEFIAKKTTSFCLAMNDYRIWKSISLDRKKKCTSEFDYKIVLAYENCLIRNADRPRVLRHKNVSLHQTVSKNDFRAMLNRWLEAILSPKFKSKTCEKTTHQATTYQRLRYGNINTNNRIILTQKLILLDK